MCLTCGPYFHHNVVSDPQLLEEVTQTSKDRNLVQMALQYGPSNFREIYDELLVVTNVCYGNEKYIQKCRETEVICHKKPLLVDELRESCWGVTRPKRQHIYLHPTCFKRPLYLITTMLHEIKHIVADCQNEEEGIIPSDQCCKDKCGFHCGNWLQGVDELKDGFGIFVRKWGVITILEGYETNLVEWKIEAKLFLNRLRNKGFLYNTLGVAGLKGVVAVAQSDVFKNAEVKHRKNRHKKAAKRRVLVEKEEKECKERIERLHNTGKLN